MFFAAVYDPIFLIANCQLTHLKFLTFFVHFKGHLQQLSGAAERLFGGSDGGGETWKVDKHFQVFFHLLQVLPSQMFDYQSFLLWFPLLVRLTRIATFRASSRLSPFARMALLLFKLECHWLEKGLQEAHCFLSAALTCHLCARRWL